MNTSVIASSVNMKKDDVNTLIKEIFYHYLKIGQGKACTSVMDFEIG